MIGAASQPGAFGYSSAFAEKLPGQTYTEQKEGYIASSNIAGQGLSGSSGLSGQQYYGGQQY